MLQTRVDWINIFESQSGIIPSKLAYQGVQGEILAAAAPPPPPCRRASPQSGDTWDGAWGHLLGSTSAGVAANGGGTQGRAQRRGDGAELARRHGVVLRLQRQRRQIVSRLAVTGDGSASGATRGLAGASGGDVADVAAKLARRRRCGARATPPHQELAATGGARSSMLRPNADLGRFLHDAATSASRCTSDPRHRRIRTVCLAALASDVAADGGGWTRCPWRWRW